MLKQRFPRVKVLASIGGWTYSKAMHGFINTDAKRKAMAQSCVSMIN